MPFSVLRTTNVRRTVEHELTKRERRAYDAAVEALKGEGCRAGGKRLAAVGGTDFSMCQRSLYGSWRMVTAYRQDGSILIISVRMSRGRDRHGSPRGDLRRLVSHRSPALRAAAVLLGRGRAPDSERRVGARLADLYGL